MRKLTIGVQFTVAAALLGAPAAAGVLVIGGSPGRGCYDSAMARSSSMTALRGCDEALAGGLMTFDDTVATYVNRGVVKIYRADYDAAVADLDEAIRLKPSEPESYLNKGSALMRMGASKADAIALYDQALRLETRRPELAYYGRAVAHELSGNIKAAYQDYRRAQEAAPKWQSPAEELARFKVIRASGTL